MFDVHQILTLAADAAKKQIPITQHAILVLGIARSGTSALSGVLKKLGIPFGSGLKPPDWQNPLGNHEHAELSHRNNKILWSLNSPWFNPEPLKEGWRSEPEVIENEATIEKIIREEFSSFPQFGIKDPRLAPLIDLYVDVLRRMDVQPVLISTKRKREEVIESIQRSGYYRIGDLSEDVGVALYEHYQQMISQAHRKYGGFQISHRDLLYNTAATISEIEARLPFAIEARDLEEAANFIDTGLHRIKHESHEGD